MEYRSEEVDAGITKVTITGALTRGPQGEELEGELAKLIADGCRKMVIDITGMHYVDSAGLGVLVASVGKMKQAGGSLRLAGANDKVTMVVRVTRIDQVVPLDAGVDASLEALRAAQ